ncbi:hypothetical protein LCGC14_1237980 [marine sediment metagenome]|uniref:Uncharacterized protein n=1 Tax=marine sediment metagenome TaxID=412755 RepID=A0A0F9LAQ9_9ZZZZ
MDDKVRDRERLKIALSILGAYQTADYTRQCRRENPIVLDRLNIALGLFDENQTDKFAECVGKNEGFTIPRACKGVCQGCKAGQRTHCPHYVEVGAVIGDRLAVRRKRNEKGKT